MTRKLRFYGTLSYVRAYEFCGFRWKQWKKIKTKHDNLVKLGIDNENAWKWANSRKAYWRISNSQVLAMSLTNKYPASVGYDDIFERYKVLHSNY